MRLAYIRARGGMACEAGNSVLGDIDGTLAQRYTCLPGSDMGERDIDVAGERFPDFGPVRR